MRQRPVRLACVGLLACLGTRADPRTDALPAFRRNVEAVRSDTESIAALWRGIRADLTPLLRTSAPDPYVVRLTLEQAVSSSDLHVLAAFDGHRVAGVGWAGGWNKALHLVLVDGIRLAAGRLTCDVKLFPRVDGSELFAVTSEVVAFRVSAVLERSQVEGRYSTSGGAGFPVRAGATRGRLLRDLVSDDFPPDDVFSDAASAADLHAAYAAACWSQTRAAMLYRLFRAVCLARANHLTLDDALARSPYFAPLPVVFFQRVPEAPAREDRAAKPSPDGKGKGKPRPPASVDAVDLDLALDGDEARSVPKRAAKSPMPAAGTADVPSPFIADRAVTLDRVREYVGRMRSAMEARSASAGKPVDFVKGTLPVDDALFGPWFDGSLPAEPGKPNSLPPHAGGDGAQAWPLVGGWRVAGPFPDDDRLLNDPLLPEVFAGADGGFVTRPRTDWPAPFAHWPAQVSWTNGPTGRWGETLVPLPANACAFACTEVHAAKACELWVAVGANDFVKVWVNDRLVAAGPGRRGADPFEDTVLFKAPFGAGPNRVTVRWDAVDRDAHFWMRICTRGRPRAAAESAAFLQRVRERRARMRNAPANVVGFRGDWTGLFPDATPVTAWDIETGDNIRWRTPLPNWGKSSPIVTGSRLFTTMDPHFLVCLDKETGRVLWTRDADVLELVAPESVAEARRLFAEYETARDAGSPQAARKWGAWQQFLVGKGQCVPSCVWDGGTGGPWVGYTFATPVSDGKRVWFKSGTGATACFDLDGNRRWMARTPYRQGGPETMCPSPVLTGDPEKGTGRLILHVPVQAPKKDPDDPEKDVPGLTKIVAYEALSGEVAWEIESPTPVGMGSPVPMRLTDGKEDMEAVVLPAGSVIRALDGKVLVKESPGYGSAAPSVHDDVFYRRGWKYGIGSAVQYLMLDRDTVGARRLWTAPPKACAMGWVYRDGYLYALAGSQFGGPYAIMDATTGAEVDRRVNTGHYRIGAWGVNGRTDSYVPTTVAGGHAFLITRGDRARKDPWAYCTVVQTGPNGRYIAHNRMAAPQQGHPFFDAERIYVRDEKSVLCIAADGDKGRAYEAEQNARWLFEDLAIEPPREMAALKPEVETGPDAPAAAIRLRECSQFISGNLTGWMLAGPFPPEAQSDLLAWAGSPVKARMRPGADVLAGGVRLRTRAIEREEAARYEAGSACRRGAWDLWAANTNRPPAVFALFTVLACDEPGVFRLSSSSPELSLWIGGARVGDQDRIELGRKSYPLLVTARVADDASSRCLWLRLDECGDYAAERERWAAGLRQSRSVFENVLKYRPGTDLAAKAAVCLKHLAAMPSSGLDSRGSARDIR